MLVTNLDPHEAKVSKGWSFVNEGKKNQEGVIISMKNNCSTFGTCQKKKKDRPHLKEMT